MQEWSSDTLWNKGKLYIERAFEQDRRSDLFPFYASLGLEFLARASLAAVHPALLADPQDGNNILYAFGFPATARPVTIPAKTVFSRLKFVIEDFSDDGSSHMCSVADVLLGAFRYCVNEPDNEEAGKAMFPTLMSMMWKRERGGKIYVNDCGLVFRPVNIKEDKHKAEYASLAERLQSYLS
jgi:hypothetical protein